PEQSEKTFGGSNSAAARVLRSSMSSRDSSSNLPTRHPSSGALPMRHPSSSSLPGRHGGASYRVRRDFVAKRKYTGNPSDIALLRFADLQFSTDSTRDQFPLVFEIPFNSTNKWQLVIVPSPGHETTRASMDVLMKGAPEVIIRRCSTYVDSHGAEHAIDQGFHDEFADAYELFGNNGRRAIAREIGLLDDSDLVLNLLTPNPETFPDTDWTQFDAAVVHGGAIDYLTPEQFDIVLSMRQVVFARTTPQHKLQIVRASQSLGECVGVAPVAMNLAFGMPAALTSLQILSVDLGTELGPAISLAYEGPESDIMSRPPRDMKKDKLMSWPMLLYSYMIAGMINTAGCFLAYASVFWGRGISLSELYMSGDDYWKTDAPDFCFGESNATCLSESEQEDVIAEACGSWYIALVLCQFFHIWMCKTRRASIFRHGVFNNIVMVYGTLVSVLLAIILVYVPNVNDVMGALPAEYLPWIIVLCSGSATWLYREGTKYVARCDEDGKPGFVSKYLLW
ncbi:hypothetical protein PybrP1_005692, partial [[Pythium] brassicae (nom. inval.)]